MRGAGRNGEQYRVVYVHVVYMLVAERAARGGSKLQAWFQILVTDSAMALREIYRVYFSFFLSLSYGTRIGTRLVDNKEEN